LEIKVVVHYSAGRMYELSQSPFPEKSAKKSKKKAESENNETVAATRF